MFNGGGTAHLLVVAGNRAGADLAEKPNNDLAEDLLRGAVSRTESQLTQGNPAFGNPPVPVCLVSPPGCRAENNIRRMNGELRQGFFHRDSYCFRAQPSSLMFSCMPIITIHKFAFRFHSVFADLCSQNLHFHESQMMGTFDNRLFCV